MIRYLLSPIIITLPERSSNPINRSGDRDMNTDLNTTTSLKGQLKGISKLIIPVILVASSSLYADDSYQLKVLFTPSDSNLQAEAKGRVMIYDGLKSETVDLAMNQQYDRIENMMFVRTQIQQEDGEYYVEEDGCD
jgi:hypothetical protein